MLSKTLRGSAQQTDIPCSLSSLFFLLSRIITFICPWKDRRQQIALLCKIYHFLVFLFLMFIGFTTKFVQIGILSGYFVNQLKKKFENNAIAKHEKKILEEFHRVSSTS